jgi:hypothetical protein
MSSRSLITPVVTLEDAGAWLNTHGIKLTTEQWGYILQPWQVPAYCRNGQCAFFLDDLRTIRHVIDYVCKHPPAPEGSLFGGISHHSVVAPTFTIDIGSDPAQVPPTFYAGCNNLLRTAPTPSLFEGDDCTESYFGLTRITTPDLSIIRAVAEQLKRAEVLRSSSAGQFANSAYYMGSKRALAPFLVEAISSVASSNTHIVDLMCGSGSAAGAFSHFWPTFASDAQHFCRALAVVQGGGFTRRRADHLLNFVIDRARHNIELLTHFVGDLVEAEDSILHDQFDDNTLSRYRDFTRRVPLYPSDATSEFWAPSVEVAARKRMPSKQPYLLCTAYFANIYFGIRQCVEIDSLRYAIDQIADDYDRAWALGALVITMSAVGLSYAGHFAQPLLRSAEDITSASLCRVLELRAVSVLHEFTIRLLSLAEESERTQFTVQPLPGPWRAALAAVATHELTDVVVYVDAPYKRDEYSRYYHVLETIANYSYPSSVGPARIPEKRSGERFKSEFATRSNKAMKEAHVKVLSQVLKNGWRAVWSYSDAGAVNPLEVAEDVCNLHRCSVRSFATPYFYKGQGGRQQKSVTEYALIFSPGAE